MTFDYDALEKASKGSAKGPWEWLEVGGDEYTEWRLSPNILLVDGSEGTPGGDEIDRANAALIAMAPDMARIVLAARDDLVPTLLEVREELVAAFRSFSPNFPESKMSGVVKIDKALAAFRRAEVGK